MHAQTQTQTQTQTLAQAQAQTQTRTGTGTQTQAQGQVPAGPRQPAPAAIPYSPVLTVDVEALFRESDYGKAVEARYQAAREDLEAENRRIVDELEAEESALTEARPTLPPDEFRARADAFDARVTKVREERDARQRKIEETRSRARAAFFQAVPSVLREIAAARSAAVVLDSRTVILSAGFVDITREAIARLNAVLPQPEPQGGSAE